MEAMPSKNVFPVWDIVKANLKHNSLLHIAAAVLLLLCAPLLFGIQQLDMRASAVPLELYAALTGILLLAPVFLPEQHKEIHDVVGVKYIGPMKVYGIRLLYSLCILCVLITVFWLYMRGRSCEADAILLMGTISEAAFLGAMGMLASATSGNVVVTYMIPVLYYVLNFAGGSRLGGLYLFSVMSGGEPDIKPLQLAGAVLMSAAAFLIKAMPGRSQNTGMLQ